MELLEYPELGMEAIWKIEVEDFPAFILVDDKGNDFFAKIREGWACAGCAIKPPGQSAGFFLPVPPCRAEQGFFMAPLRENSFHLPSFFP